MEVRRSHDARADELGLAPPLHSDVGFEARGSRGGLSTFDFNDPDRFRRTGAKSRWGGGMMVMPWAYATIEARVRRTTFEDGLAFSGRDFLETVVQLHLLYRRGSSVRCLLLAFAVLVVAGPVSAAEFLEVPEGGVRGRAGRRAFRPGADSRSRGRLRGRGRGRAPLSVTARAAS